MGGTEVIEMSVILYSRENVFKEMADSFEALKPALRQAQFTVTEDYDDTFYKALRRLHFANVATFLCQYHDDTPESKLAIDPFADFPQGNPDRTKSVLAHANTFLTAWSSLQYNLITNDGERFIAKEAHEFIEGYARRMSQCVIEREAELQQKA